MEIKAVTANNKEVISLKLNSESAIKAIHIDAKQLEEVNTYKGAVSATVIEGVASLARLVERIMKAQGASPYEIAKVLKHIFWTINIG